MIYNIVEIANTHGGSVKYINSVIDEFAHHNTEFGIKFQPFKYDEMSTEDYEYYDTYKSLFISADDWAEIIRKAIRTKDVWLDLFDMYGVNILKDNIEYISGIKLQASVLYNNNVLGLLSDVDLSNINLIVNIASHDVDEIQEILNNLCSFLNPNEILLELGFQHYPTELSDCGISKISKLKNFFNNRIVFADHLDGQRQESVELPVIAALMGVDIIEKHIMHSSLETKFDYYSSLTINKYDTYIDALYKYYPLINTPFITQKEIEYLNKTIQIPVLADNISKGSLISPNQIQYKRCGKSGLNSKKLEDVLSDFNILATDKLANNSLHREDFKKATIATIIACRLKSKRLPKKALLPIGSLSTIELCIKNTLKFENVNHTILATSTVSEDDELKNYTYRDSVIFHRGEPDDVIQRYIDICKKLKIDVIIRVTGDCLFHSNDILQFLLKSHFNNGADYTSGIGASIGTNLEIINVSALERVKKHFESADYSEYMTWYFSNNPEYFKLNMVELPEKWCRGYRLTLDYPEDLEMFKHIQEYFESNDIEYSIDVLYEFLDHNPDIAKINSHISQKYHQDTELIETLNRMTKI